MYLNYDGLKQREDWEKAGIRLPSYDPGQMTERTKKEPVWIHFGIGNIFRVFVGSIADELAEKGLIDKGIICAETFDDEIVDAIYRPFDNLSLNVILHGNGDVDRKVIGVFSEAIKAKCADKEQWERLKEVFCSPSLQMVTMTITEKGYALKDENGNWYGFARKDPEEGPETVSSAPAVYAAMLKERFEAGAFPLALVSMDNCSHNGETLRNAVLSVVQEWHRDGKVSDAFLAYISDENIVAFPWTMIDKITPRPSEAIAADLEARAIRSTGRRRFGASAHRRRQTSRGIFSSGRREAIRWRGFRWSSRRKSSFRRPFRRRTPWGNCPGRNRRSAPRAAPRREGYLPP